MDLSISGISMLSYGCLCYQGCLLSSLWKQKYSLTCLHYCWCHGGVVVAELTDSMAISIQRANFTFTSQLGFWCTSKAYTVFFCNGVDENDIYVWEFSSRRLQILGTFLQDLKRSRDYRLNTNKIEIWSERKEREQRNAELNKMC